MRPSSSEKDSTHLQVLERLDRFLTRSIGDMGETQKFDAECFQGKINNFKALAVGALSDAKTTTDNRALACAALELLDNFMEWTTTLAVESNRERDVMAIRTIFQQTGFSNQIERRGGEARSQVGTLAANARFANDEKQKLKLKIKAEFDSWMTNETSHLNGTKFAEKMLKLHPKPELAFNTVTGWVTQWRKERKTRRAS